MDTGLGNKTKLIVDPELFVILGVIVIELHLADSMHLKGMIPHHLLPWRRPLQLKKTFVTQISEGHTHTHSGPHRACLMSCRMFVNMLPIPTATDSVLHEDLRLVSCGRVQVNLQFER